jgi:hypothetical protein
MCLLILSAVSTGCGASAKPKAVTVGPAVARNAAPSREAAGEEAVGEKAREGEAVDQKAAEKKAAEEKADKEKAAKEKAAEKKEKAARLKAKDNSYVKVRVEVEIRGVLICTEEAAPLLIVDGQLDVRKWVLDFGKDEEMRAKAKDLDGKAVLVKGSAILQYQTHPVQFDAFEALKRGRDSAGTLSVLDPGPKVAVKSLVAATKK